MDFKKLKHYSHKVGTNFWHIEFAIKYRYKMFGKFKQKNIVEACIRKVCSSHHIKIHTIFVMPEHVHMLVTLPHNITESKSMQLIKGGSAYYFFKNHPKSRLRLPQCLVLAVQQVDLVVQGGRNCDDTFLYI